MGSTISHSDLEKDMNLYFGKHDNHRKIIDQKQSGILLQMQYFIINIIMLSNVNWTIIVMSKFR